jgi:ornithine cyclodeaminase/alanine dehydrogenase-like protein (mu-crystallin family)
MQRRDFIRYSALGAAAAALPLGAFGKEASAAAKASKTSKVSKNSKVQLGFIGLGQQGMYLLSSFISMDDVRVLAGCDVYDIKRERFIRRVKEKYGAKAKVDVYEDYQDLLARPDITASSSRPSVPGLTPTFPLRWVILPARSATWAT